MIQTTGGDRTVTVTLRMAASNYVAGARASAAETARLTAQQSAANASTGKLAGGMSTLTKTLIGAAGVKVALGATAGAAIEWESAFAGVTKTVEGTPRQLAEISDGLRQMSKELPTSAEELAGIAESAGQLGIETPNVLGFTKVIADLGETTNLAGQEGATQLARLANITQMSQGDFDRLGSTVVALGNNLATTEAEIVSMGLRIAGAGEQVGMTEGEILALAGALSSVGIEAEAGGTAISKVMIDIAAEVENGGDKLEMFAQVAGMSAGEFSQAWREDAAGALQTFIEGLGTMEDRGQSTLSVLEDLGITEVRMRDALLRSSGASNVLTQALDLQERAWSENTALQEEAEKRYDTTAAKIDMAKNALKDLGREAGEDVLPVLGKLAEGFVAVSESADLLGSPMDRWEDAADQAEGTGTRIQLVLEGIRQDASDLARNHIPLVGDALANWSDRNSVLARGLDSYLSPALQHFTEEWREYTIVGDEAAQGTDGFTRFLGDLGREFELAEGQLDDLSRALGGFVTPLDTYQEMVRSAAETTAESTKSSEDSWADYADAVDVSLADFAESLRRQVSDLHAWEDNLVTIAERTNAGFAMQLAELGPEAAGLIAQMADATDAELAELQQLFGERGDATGADYVNNLVDRLGDAAGAADAAMRAAVDAVTVYEDMYDAAILTADGWVRGIYDQTGAMEQAAAYAARRATNAARAELGIESPSKVFYRIAEDTLRGYELGLIDNADSVADAVEKVIGDAVDGAGSIVGAIRASMGAGGGGVDVARAHLDELLRRQEALPTDIGVVTSWVDRARENATAITPEEQARILRARDRVARAEERLAEIRADGAMSTLDLEIAENELIVAERDLVAVQKEAIAPTRELLDLQEQLRDLKSEYAHIDEDIAAARRDLTEAQLRAIEAETRLLTAQQDLVDLGPAGLELFRELAAGVADTKEELDALIRSYERLAEVATGRAGNIGGAVRDTAGSIANQVATLRANLGLPASPDDDMRWQWRIQGGSADWDEVVRRLEEKARLFDGGGVWPSGTLGKNMSGQDEYVFTSKQLAAVGGGPTSVTVVMELDRREVGRATAPVVGDEVRVKTGWKRS